MTIEVDGVKQLSRVLQKLEAIRDVFDARRDAASTNGAAPRG
jgi:GTP pyrophosphokinase